MQVEARAVGVVLRTEVDGARVQEPGDLFVRAVALQQVADQPENRLGAGHLAAVAAALEEGGGLLGVLPRFLVGERHLEDRPALVAPADLVQLDPVRVLLGPASQPRVHDPHRVIAIEGQILAGLVLDLQVAVESEEADAVALPGHRVPGRVLLGGRLGVGIALGEQFTGTE